MVVHRLRMFQTAKESRSVGTRYPDAEEGKPPKAAAFVSPARKRWESESRRKESASADGTHPNTWSASNATPDFRKSARNSSSKFLFL